MKQNKFEGKHAKELSPWQKRKITDWLAEAYPGSKFTIKVTISVNQGYMIHVFEKEPYATVVHGYPRQIRDFMIIPNG